MKDKSILLFPIGIVVALLFAEVTLEIRHYLRGYSPSLISIFLEEKNSADEESSRFGPTEEFPFFSPIVDLEGAPNKTRIWIASASHAIAGAPRMRLFPTQLCEHYSRQTGVLCASLNGSRNGSSIRTNIQLIETYAGQYRPDFIVLYQMSSEINSIARSMSRKNSTTGAASNVSGRTFNPQVIRRFIEETSAYGHLREYISGSIALQAVLATMLPQAGVDQYRREVMNFIDTANGVGSRPILTTFVTSHCLQDNEEIPYYTKLTLMRYQQWLSPEGWQRTIKQLNDSIREISRDQDVFLIDLEESLCKKSEFFTDFVHLNERGHDAFARAIADGLSSVHDAPVLVLNGDN